MNINTVSMKELREDFASVKERIEEGEELLLIYRSKPLIQMKPAKQYRKKTKKSKKKKEQTIEEKLELIEKLSGGIKSDFQWTPDELNKLYDKQYKEMLP